MSLKSRNTAMSATIQSSRGTFNTPNTTTDLMVISNCRPSIAGVTIANDEYTGSVFQNSDAVAGKNFSMTFTRKLRPPSALPAANAWVPGRFLQSAKFAEVRLATAVPASPAPVGVGSDTTHAVLGSAASTTDEIYKGYPLVLSDIGTGYAKTMTMIRHYVGATKTAELMETLGAPPAANQQIPSFIGYYRDVTAVDPPVLSVKLWLGGYRLDLVDVAVTGLRLVLPTSTISQAAYPELEYTVSGTIYATADETTPTIPAEGSIPLIKDGDVWLNKKAIATTSATLDLGLQSERPPNANQPDGVDAPELTGGTATMSLVMQKYLKAQLDTLALADAQTYHPFWMQWGNAAGKVVSIGIPDARLNFPNTDLSGTIINDNLDLLVDVLSSNLGIVFPF